MKLLKFICWFILYSQILSHKFGLKDSPIKNVENLDIDRTKNIIKKIFTIFPIVGEILALTNIKRVELIINNTFVLKETNLLQKYITMWDVNESYSDASAKILFNIAVTNAKLKFILNSLTNGITDLDERNVKIFKEIVVTVLIDAIVRTKFIFYQDLQAKENLMSIFNKPFEFKNVTKLQFLTNRINIDEKIKDEIITILMKYKTNDDVIHYYNESNEEITNSNINNLNNHNNTLSNFEALQIIQSFEFREKNEEEILNNNNNYIYTSAKLFEGENKLNDEQLLVLAEVKDKILNSTMFGENYQFTNLEERGTYQFGIEGRNIYSKYLTHIDALLDLNNILEKFPIGTLKGSVNVAGDLKIKRNFRFKSSNNDINIPTNEELKQQLLNNPEIAKHLNNDNISIIYPNHIEQFYDVSKMINKTIEVNVNSI
jgi:hypothetical protein